MLHDPDSHASSGEGVQGLGKYVLRTEYCTLVLTVFTYLYLLIPYNKYCIVEYGPGRSTPSCASPPLAPPGHVDTLFVS